MVEVTDPRWLHPTSILDVNKVFEHNHLLWIGIWVHPYTVPLAKLAQILVCLGHCGYDEMIAWWQCWGCRQPLTASHIHIGCMKSVWAPSLLLIGIWVHPPYTVTLIKLAKILVIYGQCGYEMMAWWHCWGCRPPLTASHIFIGCMEYFWAPSYSVDMHIGGPLHRYTWGGCPDCGNLGSAWLQWNDSMMTFLRL
jgi:hypothetical protein